ncbi:MAG: hypothetical protein LH606_22540 [Cytophagaceae bacterium]|nr:hypothetical protein [Cytophagaceae bacterium]
MRGLSIVFGLWLGVLVLGCKTEGPPAELPVSPPGTKTYLALGNSYTIGENVPEMDRWPTCSAKTG